MFFYDKSLRIFGARYCAKGRSDVSNLPILPAGTQVLCKKGVRYDFHKLSLSVAKWFLSVQGGLRFGTCEVEIVVTFSRVPVPPAPGRHVRVPEPGGYGGSARGAVSSFHFSQNLT